MATKLDWSGPHGLMWANNADVHSFLKGRSGEIRWPICKELTQIMRVKLHNGVIRLSTAGWLITVKS